MKKIIVYVGHPAQYHFFKNIVKILRQRNHKVLYVLRKKDVLESLLKEDNEYYINILPEGRNSSKFGILLGLIKRDIRLIPIVKREKPNLLIGSDAAITHIGKLFKIPVLTVLEDDYSVIQNLAKLSFPFTSYIVAPTSCDCGKWNFKKISYSGYMKLAYLHPNYFKPVENRTKGNKNFLIRTSKLDAHHDSGINGLTYQIIKQLIDILKMHGEVRIISEAEINSDLRQYELKINPTEIHKYLFNTDMLISDSQSMTMEAAMLGIPSIRFSDFSGKIGVLEELENKYELTYGIKTSNVVKFFEMIENLLSIDDLRSEFQKRRNRMLKDKIDVTKFFVWLIENYPLSVKEIKSDKNYQYNFR